jgi:hypothetical protein
VTLRRASLVAAAVVLLALGGCANMPSYDYSAFRQHPPRSILVLPPLNESTAVEGSASYLSTVSMPLAERGYYVFPVAVVEQLLKDNGLPTPGEMHQVSLEKLREVTGADAVLYVVLHQYGSKFQLLSTTTTVQVSARLVDTQSATLIWEGSGLAQQGTNGSGNLLADVIAAAVTQAINSKSDPGRGVSRMANLQLFGTPKRELPAGPYHPDSGKFPQ